MQKFFDRKTAYQNVQEAIKQIEKEKQIEGVLQEFDKDKLILQMEGKEEVREIHRKDIAKMKLKYHWN